MSARRRVFRIPFSRRALDSDVDAELRFHLEGRVEAARRVRHAARRRRRRGTTPIRRLDAHRRAMRAIDEETLRMRRRMDLLDVLRREGMRAARSLARSKMFTAVTVLTLALASARQRRSSRSSTAVVLRPLPYPHGSRLVSLTSPVPGIKASPLWGLARHEMIYFKRVESYAGGRGRLSDGSPHGHGRRRTTSSRARRESHR